MGNASWYRERKGDDVAKALGSVFTAVAEQSQWIRDAHEYHLGLFAGAHVSCGVRGVSRRRMRYSPSTLPDNVCRSLVDTLQAKIAKHRPLPRAMTSRGDWKKQRRARKLTQFVEGCFYKQRVFTKHGPMAVRDAGVFGDGHVAVMVHGASICTERVMPWELFVDERDAEYGDPRNLYRLRRVDIDVLLEMYGRTESGAMSTSVKLALEAAANVRLLPDRQDYDTRDTTDRVDVLEAWHLCDNLEAHQTGEDHRCTGRRVVMVSGHVLVDEVWDWDRFPIATLRYSEPVVGWHGSGLVEQLEGYQYEINAANEKLSEMYRRSGVLVVLQDGSDIVDTDVNNDVGTIVRVSTGGQPPMVQQLDLVSDTLQQRIPDLSQRAMNNSGISQMAAQSQKPSGISSGVALQTLDDVETERFVIFGRQYEAWCLELAELYVLAAKQIAATHGDFAVGVPMRAGLLELSWSDVEIDGYELRIFPTSELSTKPAAQLEKMEQWFNVGLFDGDTLFRLSDNPDVQAELELRIADKMVIDDMLERMLDADEDDEEEPYMAPTPYQDYAWAARRAQQRLNRAVLDGAPEFHQELLRQYIDDCQAMESANNPQGAPAPMPAPPGAPAPVDPGMGVPMPPPQPMVV